LDIVIFKEWSNLNAVSVFGEKRNVLEEAYPAGRPAAAVFCE